MGVSQSHSMKKEELDELHKKTHFDPKELKTMHKQFKKETPQGVITKSEFKEVMKQMGMVDPLLQELIFNVFDGGTNELINYEEFVCALSTITRGTAEEKLAFSFSMYDIDGDGFISRAEMLKVMESFYKLVGPLVTFSGKKYESPDQMVDEFFEVMDTDSDGKVSLEEYKEGAKNNADIIQGLQLFQ
eukprot:TRINITY_DN8589_c0_g1_i1.p1 TRINITY_DN8589_c0_g1~~TRINITY_DN8589_c0_g1_i1.p1  ORF type:complete len:188 (+),score=69.46 TRINITY_DN8589_c0_g1_i1:150-713(+)